MTERFITHAESEQIATNAAEKAVRSTFLLLGVDLNAFASVEEFRGDLQWLKSGRRVSRAAGTKVGSSVLGAATIGLLVAFADAIRRLITGHG